MVDSPIKRLTLADQVYDRVVEAIVVGEIAAGSPISENDIALRFGVSRGPAREAIFRLEAKGLATRAAHFGARVVDLTLEDLRSLFELREALEGMACRLAAERITDAQVEALDRSLGRHAEQPEIASGQSYYQPGGDQDFHLGIAAASQNQRLFSVLSQDLYEVMRLYRFRSSLRPGRAIEALNEHRAIVACLAARDPAKAEDAMRAHIRSSWQNTKNTFLRTGEAG
ncbi:MAG: GntR family transcriptional regulator [Bosea sp. (in: a-proteobacteria)]